MGAAQGRGYFVAFTFLQSALLYSTCLLLPVLPLLFLPGRTARRAFSWVSSTVEEAWISHATALLTYGLGVKVVLHVPAELGGLKGLQQSLNGGAAGNGGVVLLVSNHHTRIDWMFLWGLCLATGRLRNLKIILKDSLRKAPGVGWAMQCFGFIFLSRHNKEQDVKTLQDSISYNLREEPARARRDLTLLLFPEGTDLSEENLERSHEFSRKKGLKQYNEVLHPKAAGFVAAAEAMEAETRPAKVTLLDVTMGYVEHQPGQRTSEKLLFTGRPPREVHLRVGLPTLPESAELRSELCTKLFEEKEERLARFSAPVRSGGGRPDIGALAEGCDEVLLHKVPGAVGHMASSSVFLLAMEAASACLAMKSWRASLALFFTATFVFTLATRRGGVDAWQRWHAHQWPATTKRPHES